jgi:hypothetical protein
MRKLLTILTGIVNARIARAKNPVHNDALRANQPNEPYYSFSYWRSLVG